MKALHAMEKAQNKAEQAICAADQAQGEAWEAQAEAQKCSHEVSVRVFLGRLATDAVLDHQARRSGVVFEDIVRALRKDQDSGETASSQGNMDETEQETGDHSSDAWDNAQEFRKRA